MSKFSLINLVIYQTIWFVAAIYQQNGIAIISCLILIHFVLSPTQYKDVKILLLALIGICVDQALFTLGVIEFTNNSAVIPYWLMLLWCGFSLCFNHSLKWILSLPLIIQSIIGGIFGALSYFAALKFGAILTSLSPTVFILIFITIWGILFPVLSIIHKRVFSSTHAKIKVSS